MDFLKNAFCLSEYECLLLQTAYNIRQVTEINSLVDDLRDNQYVYLAYILDEPEEKVKSCFREGGNLESLGLFSYRGCLDDKAVTCISLQNLDEWFGNVVSFDRKKTVFPSESFQVDRSDAELIKSFLKGDNPVNILFHGPAGSGKTEFARYIAQSIGRELITKRPSDILNPYVGMSEKLIAEAFKEAEKSGSVLLIDEADTFLNDRASASQSWERSQVNEFLTQMEEFSGILICTTNLRKIMDDAMQRRFQLTVEFKALERGGIEKLLGKFYPQLSFSASEIDRLAALGTVTPGDFGTLSGRGRFMGEGEIDTKFVVSSLADIQREKGKGASYNAVRAGF